MTTILQQLHQVQTRIAAAITAHQRPPGSVQLLAVSKTKAAPSILTAYLAGQRQFGENYVQEALDKIIALRDDCPEISWHLIGPLQSNKTRAVAEHFDWVQSVDRLKIAQRLNEQRPADLAPLNICIQVNISQEANKSGVLPEHVAELAEQVSQLPNICLRGLMAIPEATDNVAQLTAQLVELKQLFDRMTEKYSTIDTLSMGMSNDLELAIECGSTLVRVGTAIFGARHA